MGKHLAPLLAAILVFITTVFLLGRQKEKPTEIIFELKAKVLENDAFQLFYLLEDQTGFSEKQNISVKIIGDTIIQNIEFVLPIDKPISKLRLDIGKNPRQKPMIIEYATLGALESSFEYQISKSFSPNYFITYKNGAIVTSLDSEKYDPFFVSNFDVSSVIKELSQEKSLIKTSIIYLIAFVFSLAILISLYLKKVNLKVEKVHAYILAFVLIIAIPSLVKLLNVESHIEIEEKRELATEPELSFSETFSSEYENYYNDNFGLRPTIINWSTKIKTGLFKDSSKPELVQFGKDGFLFFNQYSEEDGGVYASYSNSNLISEAQLESAYQRHVKLKIDLNEKGMEYVLGFWPNKHSIYPELLPFSMRMQINNKTSLADQVVTYFNSKKLPFFDVRSDMIKRKEDRQLYCKFDSHWNSSGAYEAYVSFCNQTFDQLALKPFSLNDFEIKFRKTQNGDLTNLLGIDSITGYHDKIPLYTIKDKSKKFRYVEPKGFSKNTIITENDNCANDKTVVVFRDSYSIALVQFLSLHFSKVVYIWKTPVSMATVERIDPDIVILGCVERRLPYLLGTLKK